MTAVYIDLTGDNAGNKDLFTLRKCNTEASVMILIMSYQYS